MEEVDVQERVSVGVENLHYVSFHHFVRGFTVFAVLLSEEVVDVLHLVILQVDNLLL